MQEQLTRFEREGDLALLRERARVDTMREIKRLLVGFWQRLMTSDTPLVHGLFNPAQ